MTADEYSEICPGLIQSAGGLQSGRGFIFQHSSDPKQKVKTGLKDSEAEKASLDSNKETSYALIFTLNMELISTLDSSWGS